MREEGKERRGEGIGKEGKESEKVRQGRVSENE